MAVWAKYALLAVMSYVCSTQMYENAQNPLFFSVLAHRVLLYATAVFAFFCCSLFVSSRGLGAWKRCFLGSAAALVVRALVAFSCSQFAVCFFDKLLSAGFAGNRILHKDKAGMDVRGMVLGRHVDWYESRAHCCRGSNYRIP